MATKAKKEEKEKKAMTAEEKAAKKKARLEAIKNRPAGQRSNSKQIDVIKFGDKAEVQNFGCPVKNREGHQGILVTSVVVVEGSPVSTAVTFIPGNLTIKVKKEHGAIVSPKNKKGKDKETDAEEEED